MRITIEPTHEGKDWETPNPTVTIMIERDDLSLDKIMEDMIEPALMAYGFPKVTKWLIEHYSKS